MRRALRPPALALVLALVAWGAVSSGTSATPLPQDDATLNDVRALVGYLQRGVDPFDGDSPSRLRSRLLARPGEARGELRRLWQASSRPSSSSAQYRFEIAEVVRCLFTDSATRDLSRRCETANWRFSVLDGMTIVEAPGGGGYSGPGRQFHSDIEPLLRRGFARSAKQAPIRRLLRSVRAHAYRGLPNPARASVSLAVGERCRSDPDALNELIAICRSDAANDVAWHALSRSESGPGLDLLEDRCRSTLGLTDDPGVPASGRVRILSALAAATPERARSVVRTALQQGPSDALVGLCGREDSTEIQRLLLDLLEEPSMGEHARSLRSALRATSGLPAGPDAARVLRAVVAASREGDEGTLWARRVLWPWSFRPIAVVPEATAFCARLHALVEQGVLVAAERPPELSGLTVDRASGLGAGAPFGLSDDELVALQVAQSPVTCRWSGESLVVRLANREAEPICVSEPTLRFGSVWTDAGTSATTLRLGGIPGGWQVDSDSLVRLAPGESLEVTLEMPAELHGTKIEYLGIFTSVEPCGRRADGARFLSVLSPVRIRWE